jgi:hypothetical protein
MTMLSAQPVHFGAGAALQNFGSRSGTSHLLHAPIADASHIAITTVQIFCIDASPARQRYPLPMLPGARDRKGIQTWLQGSLPATYAVSRFESSPNFSAAIWIAPLL